MIKIKRKRLNSHLILESRYLIEEYLNNGNTVSEIAEKLDRDRSNIADEILKNRIKMVPSGYGDTSTCIHKDICRMRKYECDKNCINYEMELCIKLKTSPHVCNNCHSKSCRKVKFYYKAKEAEEQYKTRLINSRNNLHYTELELNVLNGDFYYLVIACKSIYHALQVINSTGFNFKLKTIYRQIKDDRLRLKPSDLPRTNTIIKKETKDKSYKRDITGHTFEDYTTKIEKEPNIVQWQMDCVQGIIGKNEQVFLTLQIVKIKFLFIFPIKAQTQDEVAEKLEKFNGILNEDSFNKLIELLLTDNRHEFIDLERLCKILNTTNIYYCHPYSSCEKGSIENNHELIRRVIPQGVSLSIYTEDDIKLLCSHINSLYRDELDGKCPFDLIQDYLSDKTLKKIGYKKIESNNVMLIPELLGDKNIKNIKKYLDDKDIKKANINFIKDDEIKKQINEKIMHSLHK